MSLPASSFSLPPSIKGIYPTSVVCHLYCNDTFNLNPKCVQNPNDQTKLKVLQVQRQTFSRIRPTARLAILASLCVRLPFLVCLYQVFKYKLPSQQDSSTYRQLKERTKCSCFGMYCVGKGPTARSKKPNNKSLQNLVHCKYLMVHNFVYTKA
jgi:hypothetical protein